MSLNIKNDEVVRLAREVAEIAGESQTEAIRAALMERRERLKLRTGRTSKQARLEKLLKERIWPKVPASVRGKRVTKKERERILGYGPGGV
jgi:antitoxin VapB